MNDDSFDGLIRKYASGTIPSAPGNLESRVWREIRARQSERARRSTWLLHALRLWPEPRSALASILAAVAIGVGMSWWAIPASGATKSAQRALDLSVFSAQPPSLPSTLLSRGHE